MKVLVFYLFHFHYYLMYLKQQTIDQNIKRERIFKNLPIQMDGEKKLEFMRCLKGGERAPIVEA